MVQDLFQLFKFRFPITVISLTLFNTRLLNFVEVYKFDFFYLRVIVKSE